MGVLIEFDQIKSRAAGGMNHDATHCADYRRSRCPKRCPKARLTWDLLERKARGESFGPVSFEHLRGTGECWEKREAETT